MTRLFKLTAAAIICGLTLAACGGGGDDTSASSTGGGGGSSNPTGGGGTGGGSSGSGGGSDPGSPPQTTSYTVTPSVSGSGGTISPMAPVPVPSGTTVSFTLAPASGYTVGPVNGTCGGTLSGNTYTTVAVTANCTVEATFASSTPPAPVYEGLTPATSATDFLAQLNQEGVKGYRYLYDQSFISACTDNNYSTCGPFPPPVSVFVNDGMASSYAYELQADPGNVSDFLAQANAEGAKGYRFAGWYGMAMAPTAVTPPPYALYRKDGASTATYAYVADAAGPMTSDAFVSQVNTRGQSGYWFYGRIGNYFPAAANLYVKNNASSATYAYEAVTLGSLDSYLSQFNSEGARGYRLTYQLTPSLDIPATSLFAMLYMRDQTQSATFAFQSTSPAMDGPDFIDQLNSYSTQGYATWMNTFLYYFKATGCSGWLCTTLDRSMLISSSPGN